MIPIGHDPHRRFGRLAGGPAVGAGGARREPSGTPPNDVFPRAGSALIGAGDPGHVVADDFNGDPRNGAADVGAYRYAASGNPGSPLGPGFKGGPADADGGAGSSGSAGTGGAGGSVGPTGTGGVGGGDRPGVSGSPGCGCMAGGAAAGGPAVLLGAAAALHLARRRTRRT